MGSCGYGRLLGDSTMKTFLKTIYSFLHSVGQAKAAAHFARMGDYKSARAVYKS